jgi:hypothetical protein
MVAPVRAAVRNLLGLSLVWALAGCDNLNDFSGEFELTILNGNFVRSCFAPNTEATLSFDPSLATGDLSTVPLERRNWLDTTDGTFTHTQLEPVRKLEEDQLSLFDFPGPQKLRNYIMLARPTSGPLQDRDAFVVISLLDEKNVEVRVIARTGDSTQPCAVDADGGAALVEDAGDASMSSGVIAGPREYFGIFRPRSK